MPQLHAETLRIQGPDALTFAHAVFSSDIHALPGGQWQWSAWLDPQGRVRFVFQALRETSSTILLLLRGSSAQEMAIALRPFVLRRQVELAPQPPRALCDAPPSTAHQCRIDADGIWLGMGGYGMRIAPDEMDATPPRPTQAWRHAAILAGHPWLASATAGKILAASLPLQTLGAVSMDKGCFPGQEVVARLHFRGGCKRHMRRIRAAVQLEPGAALTQSGRAAGVILDSIEHAGQYDALAVLHDTVTGSQATLEIADQPHKMALYDAM